MNELIEKLRREFQDEEYRHSYAEECLNTMIAAQIKVLREQRRMTQGDLAEKCEMKQPRIPLLEDANYANWTIKTLKRLARAFDVALSVKFETFSNVVSDFERMSEESLQRASYADDVVFRCSGQSASRILRRDQREPPNNAAIAAQMNLPPTLPEAPILQQSEASMFEQGGQYAASVSAAG